MTRCTCPECRAFRAITAGAEPEDRPGGGATAWVGMAFAAFALVMFGLLLLVWFG